MVASRVRRRPPPVWPSAPSLSSLVFLEWLGLFGLLHPGPWRWSRNEKYHPRDPALLSQSATDERRSPQVDSEGLQTHAASYWSFLCVKEREAPCESRWGRGEACGSVSTIRCCQVLRSAGKTGTHE